MRSNLFGSSSSFGERFRKMKEQNEEEATNSNQERYNIYQNTNQKQQIIQDNISVDPSRSGSNESE